MTAAPDFIRKRFAGWAALVLLLVPALALFVWAGSSWDPRFSIPYTWNKTGWLLPAPGWGFLWGASVLLVWILSEIAWRLFHPVAGGRMLKPWVSAAIIFLLGVGVRVAIVRWWTPLPLNAAGLAAAHLLAAGHWLPVLADLVVIGLLMMALAGSGRSIWWAALYALHPLPLIVIAGGGQWIGAALIPLVFVVGVSHRIPRFFRMLVTAGFGLTLFAVILVLSASSAAGFNSFAWDVAQSLGLRADIVLPAAAGVGLAVVMVLASRGSWTLGRTIGHLILVAAICAPTVQPWCVVPLVVLAPLAWTRGGWVLGAGVLAAYVVVPVVRGGGGFHVPEWALLVEWVPVMVLELHELWGRGALFSRAPSASSAAPVT